MEEVFNLIVSTVEGMEAAGVMGVVFWDSVAATPLQAELDATMEENQAPGARARFLSKHLPQVVAKLRSGLVGLVFVNQLREKIGVTWGKTTFSPGGRALRHYAHVRLELTGFGQIKGPGGQVIGIKTRVKAVKNKIGMPYREAELEIRYDPPGPRIIAAGAEKATLRKPARYNSGRRT
jgi:recombination protein RecA